MKMRPSDVEMDADFFSAIPEGQSTPQLDAAVKDAPKAPKDAAQESELAVNALP